jgi:two-component system, NtrC family, sensor histidine kinase HydH
MWGLRTEVQAEAPFARVLVVDDENGPRQALRMLLKEHYDVELVSGVAAALETLRRQPVDLIITDIRMPHQSGVDLLRQAKEFDPDIQVIILTGYGELETARKAVEYGAFAYLEKPFDSDSMLLYVESAVRKHREEQERRTLEHLALEANRFETLGRVISCMMHDLGSPLTVIESTVELMLACSDIATDERRLHTLLAQVRHCNEMVRSTMGFLRSDQNEIGRFSLNEVVETCLDVAHPFLRKQRVTIARDLSMDLPMCPGDLTLVRQAVLNLITNACHAMEGQATPMTITMATRRVDNGACLSVLDSGPGVEPENRERIFDTFYTTKGDKGTGLGLTVVRYVMDKHGGSVMLMPPANGGAEFVLIFPAACSNGKARMAEQVAVT